MKITAILNQKGGVAKTTTAANMAAVLQKDHGKKVLLIDADGQCDLSNFFGVNENLMGSMMDVMRAPKTTTPDSVIYSTQIHDVDIVPAVDRLMELDISCIKGGKVNANALKIFLDKVANRYDYCIIDCPPAFNAASAAALVAADNVIVPIKLDAFSLHGMKNIMHQVKNMQALNPNLIIAGLLPTMFYSSPVTNEARDILVLSDYPVFPSIRRSDKVDTMTYAGVPLCIHSPKSAAGVDYRRFVSKYVEV